MEALERRGGEGVLAVRGEMNRKSPQSIESKSLPFMLYSLLPSSVTTTALVLICRRRGLKVCGRNKVKGKKRSLK